MYLKFIFSFIFQILSYKIMKKKKKCFYYRKISPFFALVRHKILYIF